MVLFIPFQSVKSSNLLKWSDTLLHIICWKSLWNTFMVMKTITVSHHDNGGSGDVALRQLIWIKLMVWNVTYCTKSITSSWPSVKKDFQIEVYFEIVLLIVCTCVLRWNVVGIQGSLMSYFTEPIYFSSIILGSLYHADHLSRAMYQRIADIEDLPQQFTLNRPLLSGQCLLLSGVE